MKSLLSHILLALLVFGSNQSYAINAPVNNSPANGSSFSKFDIFIYVNAVTGAKGYQFQIDTLSSFNSLGLFKDTTQNQYVYSPLLKIGKTYFWRARAYSGVDTSAWSAIWSFTATNAVQTLNSPANNTTGPIVLLRPMSSSSLAAVNYIIEADTNVNLNSPIKVVRNQSNTNFTDSVLFGYGRNLYWRAKSYSSYGDTFQWSGIYKYTIHTQPTLNGNPSTLLMVDPKITPNWTNVGLSSIHLQLDTTMSYNTARLIDHIIPPGYNADTIYNLFFGKDYFYRIRCEYQGKVSTWSFNQPIRVKTNGYLSSPTNGSTVYGLTTNFGWSALNGTKYHFILFGDSAETIVLKDTITNIWNYSYKNELKLNKWYHYKVTYFHDLDAASTLTAYFKTYTGMVNLGAPYANATNVSVRPRLNFRKQTWGTGYIMEIDTGSVFTSVHSPYYIRIIDSFSYDGSYYHYKDTSLLYGQKYVWRVAALMGADTAEATTSNFTTAAYPVNYFPPNNYIGTGTSTNGLVTGITGSNWIQWELDSTLNFNSPLRISGTDPHVPDGFTPAYVGLNFSPDLNFETKYYWHARCINNVDTGNWGNAFNFLTTQPVWAINPLNGASNIATSVNLQWGVQGSTSELLFQYQASKDSNFIGTPIMSLAANASPNATISCQYATKYFWRARAINAKDTSNWSPTFNFTTQNPPAIARPQLLLPVNGVINVKLGDITLVWSAVSNAFSYDVQVSDTSDFTTIVASGTTAGTSSIFTGATKQKTYYWRVRGRILDYFGPWSYTSTFKTGVPSGIEDLVQVTNTLVYPNPSSSSFTISRSGNFSFQVYSSEGKFIFGSNQNIDMARVEVQNWPAGLYLILIEQDGKTMTQRLQVNK